MSIEQFTTEFLAEYARRTRISFEEGGGSDDEIERYFDSGYSPSQAVSAEIQRYGLADFAE